MEVTIQHPLADIEMIVWHYTFIIILTKDEDVIEKVKRYYPNAINLIDYNAENN